MIKLLLISNRYPAHPDDGASPFVFDFVKRLRQKDIDVTVLTPYHKADRYDDEYNAIRFKWSEAKKTIGSLSKYSPLSWYKIYKYFKNGVSQSIALHEKNNFDFTLALWSAPSGIFAKKLKDMYGMPYAVWCLGSDIHSYAQLPVVGKKIIEVIQAADRSYSDGIALSEMAEKLAGRECHFLPSMRKVDFREEEQAGTENLFVCPGRVCKSKGVFDLLEAFHLIIKEFPSWSLCYIGDGPDISKLQNKIKTLGLQSRVKNLGFLPREKMFRIISSAAAAVIPTHVDSLPLTFSEAMQLKKPVIVTDIGDLKHFTEKYHTGIVVPPNSPKELANAMKNIIQGMSFDTRRFALCVEELDVDRSADTFTEWLKNHLSHGANQKEPALC
ncbi:MAG: glycosyltransferase [candidate division Zixibacteria bacterium]